MKPPQQTLWCATRAAARTARAGLVLVALVPLAPVICLTWLVWWLDGGAQKSETVYGLAGSPVRCPR
jgi:hypothetical protein